MAYFESLKKTLKHINSEVTELKKTDPSVMFRKSKFYDDPAPGIPPFDDEEIRKRISDRKSLLKHTKINTLNLKATVQHRVERIQKYHCDMEAMYFEVDSASHAIEKRLMQFGYCPLKLKTHNEVDSADFPSNGQTIHQNDSEEIAKSVTPKLEMHKISPGPSKAVGACNIEEGDKTPVLISPGPSRVRVVGACKIEGDKTPVLSLDLVNKDFKAIRIAQELAQVPVLCPLTLKEKKEVRRKQRRKERRRRRLAKKFNLEF